MRYISSGAEELRHIKNMETTSAVFHRFHKKPSGFLGKPASFHAYQAKSASREAILSDMAKLNFSGMVQL